MLLVCNWSRKELEVPQTGTVFFSSTLFSLGVGGLGVVYCVSSYIMWYYIMHICIIFQIQDSRLCELLHDDYAHMYNIQNSRFKKIN